MLDAQVYALRMERKVETRSQIWASNGEDNRNKQKRCK